MFFAILSTLISFVGVYYIYFVVLKSESKTTFKKYLFDRDIRTNIIRISVSVISSLFISYFLVKIFEYNNTSFLKILFGCIAIFLVLFCVYISLFDLEYFEIPFLYTLLLVALIIISSIGLIIFSGTNTVINIWDEFSIQVLDILIGGFISGAFVGLIVLFSHERAMGIGDIPIAAMMGLILTSKYLLAGFYVTILTALVFGLVTAAIVRRFKGLKIPFVPFICLGILGGMVFGEAIMKYLFLIT